jgi:hypothetical protein
VGRTGSALCALAALAVADGEGGDEALPPPGPPEQAKVAAMTTTAAAIVHGRGFTSVAESTKPGQR